MSDIADYIAKMSDNDKLKTIASMIGLKVHEELRFVNSEVSDDRVEVLALDGSGGTVWNPLKDDGDCAKLEAILKFNIVWYPDRVSVKNFRVMYDGDAQAARRLACVNAAVAMAVCDSLPQSKIIDVVSQGEYRTCNCQTSDSWRCAVQRNLRSVHCHCQCHSHTRFSK